MKLSSAIIGCVVAGGVLASVTPADSGKCQAIGPGRRVEPVRIGRLGTDPTVAEWAEYDPDREGRGGGRQAWTLVWDAFDPLEDGSPWYGDGAYMPRPRDRLYFGATYSNLYYTNDMQFDPAYGGHEAERVELAWFWVAHGQGTGENCAIIVAFYEDFDDTCVCGDACLGTQLGRVVFDLGYVEANDPTDYPNYYYCDVDLRGYPWLRLPTDGAGAYSVWFATYDDADPDALFPATSAQPMLWGCNNPAHDGPGTQVAEQWDDDNRDDPPDWIHQVPDECCDHGYGMCPDPLCGMFCIWIATDCAGDADGDGDTDQADLGILLADWGCTGGDCPGDVDGDGETGQSDLGVLLSDWGCGT